MILNDTTHLIKSPQYFIFFIEDLMYCNFIYCYSGEQNSILDTFYPSKSKNGLIRVIGVSNTMSSAIAKIIKFYGSRTKDAHFNLMKDQLSILKDKYLMLIDSPIIFSMIEVLNIEILDGLKMGDKNIKVFDYHNKSTSDNSIDEKLVLDRYLSRISKTNHVGYMDNFKDIKFNE